MKLRIIIEAGILMLFLITIPIVILVGRSISTDGDESADVYIQRGNQLYNQGHLKFSEAAIQYWEAVKRNPDAVDARLKLAEIYHEFLWNYEALQQLEEVKKLNPNYPGLYLLMGKVYDGIGDKNKAFDAFQRAISQGIKASEAHYYLGNIYEQRDAKEEAIKQYNKAIDVWTPDQDKEFLLRANLQLGRIYEDRGELKKAEENFKSALDANPESVEVISELKKLYEQEAQAYETQRDYEKAAEKYEEILKIDPDNPDNIQIYMKLGNIYRSQELYDKAISIYKIAVELDPLNYDAFSALKELELLKNSRESQQ